MISEPARLSGISLSSHLGEMKIFHMNTHKWASPARWDSMFFNLFLFQILIK